MLYSKEKAFVLPCGHTGLIVVLYAPEGQSLSRVAIRYVGSTAYSADEEYGKVS